MVALLGLYNYTCMDDKNGLRLLNPSTDLEAVADLIELCFSDHMDADGREFTRYLRQAASDRFSRLLISSASGSELSPLGGFVWEVDGRIIGNLSLIPFRRPHGVFYLIANVAVHPDFRRLGIGRQLTQRAIAETRSRHALETWLHVRTDNINAYQLYLQLGFEERHRRSTWEADQSALRSNNTSQCCLITPRRFADWLQQKNWLAEDYPEEIRWNLSLKEKMLKPSVLNELSHFFENDPIQQFALHIDEELLGIVAWQPSTRHADHVWLATSKQREDDVIYELLPAALQRINATKPFLLNFPVNRGEKSLPEIGFRKINTLAWMKLQS
jgi:ribosomal protein S18 acetylase RimI-like enzyme